VSPRPGLVSFNLNNLSAKLPPQPGLSHFEQVKRMFLVFFQWKRKSFEMYAPINLFVPAPAGRQYGSKGM
jgi:hypothetical protein